MSEETTPVAPVQNIVIRLRDLANAFKMWRVRDKTDGSYCMEFEEWEEREAEEWFAQHAAKNPDRFANRELALVVVQSPQSQLATEAANLLEVLIDQFQMHSPKMDGSHRYRFRDTGWPMTHLVGPSIMDALQNVVNEVQRSRKEMMDAIES